MPQKEPASTIKHLPNPYAGLKKAERLERYYRMHGHSADDPLGYDKCVPARQCDDCHKWYYPPGAASLVCLHCHNLRLAAEPEPRDIDLLNEQIVERLNNAHSLAALIEVERFAGDVIVRARQCWADCIQLTAKALEKQTAKPSRYANSRVDYRQEREEQALNALMIAATNKIECERVIADFKELNAQGGAEIIPLRRHGSQHG